MEIINIFIINYLDYKTINIIMQMIKKKFVNKKNTQIKVVANNIRQQMRLSVLFAQNIAEKMNLHLSDVRCLDYLIKAKSATAGEISKIIGLTTGATTAMIDRLEKIKLIKRTYSQEDRRKTIIVFTGNNNSVFKNTNEFFTKDIYKLLNSYSYNDLKLIDNWNRKLIKLLQNKGKK